jgi:hypothetical protein
MLLDQVLVDKDFLLDVCPDQLSKPFELGTAFEESR